MTFEVYKITNKINGLSYVGQTTNTATIRFMHHTKPHKTRETYLSRAIAKYGKENFSFAVLSECQNTIMSEQTRKKMSLSKIGRRSNAAGRSLSPEHKAKLSDANKGRPHRPKIKIQCLETLVVFDSMFEAAQILGVRQGHISEVCIGDRKTAGGLTFRKVG